MGSPSSSRTISAESSTNPSINHPKHRCPTKKHLVGHALHKASTSIVVNQPTNLMGGGDRYHGHGHHDHDHHPYHGHHDHDHHPHQPNSMHACSHCPKRFPTSQALGGHQNAHRRERHSFRKSLTMDLQEQIAENDIRGKEAVHNYANNNTDHHHHYHHQIHHHDDDDHVVHSPQPLRAVYPNHLITPMTQYQQVDHVGPSNYQPPNYHGLKLSLNMPKIDHQQPSLNNWVPPPFPPPAIPSPVPSPFPSANALPSWKPNHPSYQGVMAPVSRPVNPVNPELGFKAWAEPFFPPGFAAFHQGRQGTNNTSVNVNQNAAPRRRVNDITKEDPKTWGRDLKLGL